MVSRGSHEDMVRISEVWRERSVYLINGNSAVFGLLSKAYTLNNEHTFVDSSLY